MYPTSSTGLAKSIAPNDTPIAAEIASLHKNIVFFQDTIDRLRSSISAVLPNVPQNERGSEAVNPTMGNSSLYVELAALNKKTNDLVNELCSIIDSVEL